MRAQPSPGWDLHGGTPSIHHHIFRAGMIESRHPRRVHHPLRRLRRGVVLPHAKCAEDGSGSRRFNLFPPGTRAGSGTSPYPGRRTSGLCGPLRRSHHSPGSGKRMEPRLSGPTLASHSFIPNDSTHTDHSTGGEPHGFSIPGAHRFTSRIACVCRRALRGNHPLPSDGEIHPLPVRKGPSPPPFREERDR